MAKGGNGEGPVYKQRNGLWAVSISIERGKRRRGTPMLALLYKGVLIRKRKHLKRLMLWLETFPK